LAIFNRFPKRSQIAAVYAIIVMVIYTWTILWYFWKLSSWLYYLTIWEIIKVFSYSIATNFLESLAVLSLPVLLAVVLPQKWFRDGFVARSALVVLTGLTYMIYLANLIQGKEDYPSAAIQWVPVILVLNVLLAFLVVKIPIASKLIEAFADLATVFLYLTIPLSLICTLFVLVQLVI
jgi:hypothetical protein